MKRLFLYIHIFLAVTSAPLLFAEPPPEEEKVVVPVPTELRADWLHFLQVGPDKIDQRVNEIKSVIKSFDSQLDNPDQRKQAENEVKQLKTHLESLNLIKKQVVQKEPLTWLPKEVYTLNDYLDVSDKIRSLKLRIQSKETDKHRFIQSANDRQHTLNEKYSHYLSLPQNSVEKFLQGLRVMVLGVRYLYLEAEAKFTQELIKSDLKKLARYQKERDLIDEELVTSVNIREIELEKRQIEVELDRVLNKLSDLESQYVAALSSSKNEEPQLINQQLTNSLINEALLKSKLFFAKAKILLNLSLTEPDQVSYQNDIEPIKAFHAYTENQISTWKKLAATRIDQLSQALINEESEGAEESLKLSLESRNYLESLSKELYHIQLVLNLIDQHVIERQAVIDQVSYNFQHYWHEFQEYVGDWFYISLFELGGVPITVFGLIKALFILFCTYLLSYFVRRSMRKLAKGKGKASESTLYTFRRIIHYLIMLFGVLFALASLGLTMQNMAIILGALGVGIGFGLQNIVNNFLSGLAILVERHIKVGDYIEIENGLFGKVVEVNIQNTTLHTFDGLDVVVPNSHLMGNNVVNWTKKDPYQRLKIPFGVAYGTDQDFVNKIVCEAAAEVPHTIIGVANIRDPEVWLVEFGESALNFELVVWVNIFRSRGRNAMKAAYLSAIERAFKENGIHIPFPQRDIHIKKDI